MTFNIHEPGTIFALLMAFYVCLHCALTIVEISRTEKAASRVPTPFAKTVSLAAHRKAVDYNAEIMQCDLVNALVGAAIAVIFTFAGALNGLLSAIEDIWEQGVFTQFLLVVAVSAILVLVDLPLCWWREFRVNERFGYERSEPRDWITSTLVTTLVGWLCEIPILVACIIILGIFSDHWWLAASLICTVWFWWLWISGPAWRIRSDTRVKRLEDDDLRRIIGNRLFKEGFVGCDILIAPAPKNSIYGDGVLIGRRGRMQLVLYDFVFERLTENRQIEAIATLVIGRKKLHLNALRFILSSLFMLGFWMMLAHAFTHPTFYEALGMSADVALRDGKPLAGLVISLMLIAAPILLYPLVFVLHFFSRSMDYLADGWAVRRVGSRALVSALIHLYQDYRITLEPNVLYSLANHRRPHVTQRIRAARILDIKLHAKSLKAMGKPSKNGLVIPSSVMTQWPDNRHG